MATIVISYRREDSKWIADRIFDRFETHYGKGNVFMDIDSIPFGLDFRDHIRETLDRCDVMVALVGPNWIGRDQTGDHILNETDWVRIEVEAALNKKIPLIPVLIDGSRMPKPEDLPDSLKNFVFRQAAGVDREHFHAQMDKVIASIDQHLSKVGQARPIEPIVQQPAAPVVQKIVQPPIEKARAPLEQTRLEAANATGRNGKVHGSPGDMNLAVVLLLIFLIVFGVVLLGIGLMAGIPIAILIGCFLFVGAFLIRLFARHDSSPKAM
jgi:hypothetical protein